MSQYRRCHVQLRPEQFEALERLEQRLIKAPSVSSQIRDAVDLYLEIHRDELSRSELEHLVHSRVQVTVRR